MDDTVTTQDVRRDHAALVYLNVALIGRDLQRFSVQSLCRTEMNNFFSSDSRRQHVIGEDGCELVFAVRLKKDVDQPLG